MLIAAQEVDPVQLDPYASSNFSALQAYEFIYESLTGYDEKTQIIPALAETLGDAERHDLRLPPAQGRQVPQRPGDDRRRRGVQPRDGGGREDRLALALAAHADQEHRGQGPVHGPGQPQHAVSRPARRLRGAAGTRPSSRRTGTSPIPPSSRRSGPGRSSLPSSCRPTTSPTSGTPTTGTRDARSSTGMTFKIMLDQNARIAALRSGQIQYATLDAQGAEQLKGQQGIQILSSPSAWLTTHPFNVSRKPFDDKRVRQALRMAVDTKEVIQKAVFGAGVPSGAIANGFGDWGLPESRAEVHQARHRGGQEAAGRGRPSERLRDDDHLLAAVPGVRRHLAGLPGGLEEDRRRREGRADRVGRLHQALGEGWRLRLRHRRDGFHLPPGPGRLRLPLLQDRRRQQHRLQQPEDGRAAGAGPHHDRPGEAQGAVHSRSR